MAPSHQSMVYQKDEKVLCFHHELLYEAKVLDYKPSDPNDKKSPLHYRVHYKGWKNT
ncbi:Esa1p-associated factor, partial [Trichoglossum hirsutum]